MTLPEWSFVQYRIDDAEGVAVGVRTGGTVVQGPPGTEGLTLMEVLGRWESLAPLLRDWTPATSAPIVGARLAPPLTYPGKVMCAGANYWDHCAEMGIKLPDELGDPFFFLKPPVTTVTGPGDQIPLPNYQGARVDWEAELGVVIGAEVRNAGPDEARAAIAGYTVVNDISVRDYQNRTLQWLQGKMFEGTTPVGPWLVTDVEPGEISCAVDGEQVQQAHTGDLVFDPVALVTYISTIITLAPGDLIATGTPGGVGHARTPPRYLRDGSEVVTRVAGVGECRNTCRRGPA
jgi:2-keto-4-pentenoate hydratase/2-oxohepta-3-ene-1,7-dioic acid hydratase in catechol pathway